MNQKDSDNWLVKCSGRILGPMSFSEVIRRLKNRELYILDEVAQPLRRWISLQESEEFRQAIDELRRSGDKGLEGTMTLTGGTTANLTFTEPIDIEDDEQTTVGRLKEIVYENVTETAQKTNLNSSVTPSVPVYGLRSSSQVQLKAQSVTRWFWWVAALAAVIGVGFFSFQMFIKKPKLREQAIQDDYQQGMTALDVGDYPTALSHLRRYHLSHPEDQKVFIYLAMLLIQVENQTVESKLFLSQMLGTHPQSTHEIWTAIGLAQQLDGRQDSAAESFNKALEEDPHYFPALINLGLISLQKKDFLRSKTIFESVINKTDTEPTAFLFLAETLINLYLAENSKAYLTSALEVLDDFLKSAQDYAQEADFLGVYALVLKGDLDEALQRAGQVLDRDPQLTDNHNHNLFINSRRLSWRPWLKWCEQAQLAMGLTANSTSLLAYCQYRNDRHIEAKKTIENAVAQAPKDPLVQSLYSFILSSSHLEDEASVALGKAMELDVSANYQLPRILQAQFCERQKDFDCAQKYWTELLSHNPNNLTALAGMAEHEFDAKNFLGVQSYLTRGLTISPDYKPLRRLAHQAELAGLKIFK
jgi:tetratricopeptide (TPR) repeat protein